MDIAPEMRARVAQLLGRPARGLQDVITSATGDPLVIRVASLVDDKPFPTLYWLVDPDLCYRIDQAEAGGLIRQFQQRIDETPALIAAMSEDHATYIADRDSFLEPEQRSALSELGFGEVLASKGVGGIADFSRIRCLHTWYGAHLVRPNTIGCMLDEWWAEQATQSSHPS
ncbi:MAG: hypothetical protein ACI9NT_001481 [Bacteroidia bacterium]